MISNLHKSGTSRILETDEEIVTVIDKIYTYYAETSLIVGPIGNIFTVFFHDLVIHFSGILIQRVASGSYVDVPKFPYVDKRYSISPYRIDLPTSLEPRVREPFKDWLREIQIIPLAIGNNTFVSMELIRNNSIINKNLELQFDKKLNKKIIGITSTSNLIIERFDILKSIKQSFIFIPNYYYQSYSFLVKSFNDNTLTDQLAGPIGIVKMADQMMLDKLTGVLLLFIVISLFVGLFNLFPIPLLDGGHIVYFIISKIFSNSLPEFVTRIYLVVGITIISFLFIIVTFNDIFYK